MINRTNIQKETSIHKQLAQIREALKTENSIVASIRYCAIYQELLQRLQFLKNNDTIKDT